MAKQNTPLSVANVNAVNENGQSSVDLDLIDQHVVNSERFNFSLQRR